MFSVIMPLYNKAPFVRKAVESVLSQTYSDWELVIVDDGSSDESFEVASESVAGCGKARIVRQENAGVSTARNNGVALSAGDFVCFLDADDWWAPTFLEEMAGLIAEFPDAGIYGCGYTIVNETRHKTRVAPIALDEGFTKGYIDYCGVYARNLCMPLWTGAVCVPRKIFDSTKGFNPALRIGEDFDMWLQIALKWKVAFNSQALSFYNQDVDLKNRAVNGVMHEKDSDFLFNKDAYLQAEMENSGLKELFDKQRLECLLPYYFDKGRKKDTIIELSRVKWNNQPFKYFFWYRTPYWFARAFYLLKMSLYRLLVRHDLFRSN